MSFICKRSCCCSFEEFLSDEPLRVSSHGHVRGGYDREKRADRSGGARLKGFVVAIVGVACLALPVLEVAVGDLSRCDPISVNRVHDGLHGGTVTIQALSTTVANGDGLVTNSHVDVEAEREASHVRCTGR